MDWLVIGVVFVMGIFLGVLLGISLVKNILDEYAIRVLAGFIKVMDEYRFNSSGFDGD